MFRIGLMLLVAVLAALAAVLFLRPGVAPTSGVDPDVTVECTGATGFDQAACLAWGDGIIGDGAPSTTFEAEDVVRVRLDRELFGLADSCVAAWFLGRYPDEAVWTERVACAEG